MNSIFGLDLGTNSIGWALRNPALKENQIEKFGVLTFNKGVGNSKTGEYSYAAERTKKRSTRRLYQARKYRLWTTLAHLIAEGYCPCPWTTSTNGDTTTKTKPSATITQGACIPCTTKPSTLGLN
jgi:CRISPR/Cas system Type II protein with McrA/HNH and RuvC-like nuclease domain